MKEECADGVSNKYDGNEDWFGLKRKLLAVANEVCVYIKDKPRDFETFWQIVDVDLGVCRNRVI